MKAKIFMTSGNVIELHGVKRFTYQSEKMCITQIKVTYRWYARFLRKGVNLAHINLHNIEAITGSV